MSDITNETKRLRIRVARLEAKMNVITDQLKEVQAERDNLIVRLSCAHNELVILVKVLAVDICEAEKRKAVY